MIEQKIEKIVIDKLSSTLSASGIDDIQIVGAWQPSEDDEVKGLEDGTMAGLLTVKTYPRQYDTPTIPDGSMQVEITLLSRADVDWQGTNWLSATDAVNDVIQAWQKTYNTYKTDFEIQDEFMPTGFNIAGGDCGLDKANGVWTYTQSFNLFGVIN